MELKEGRVFLGRLKAGSDLLRSLTDICEREKVNLGVFQVIGAVTSAKLGYYDQALKKYNECLELDKKLEISGCMGNISLNEEKIFVHAHVTLAGHDGSCYGGHLMNGSVVFAAEYYIKELKGARFERVRDEETGLLLWPLQ